MLCHHQIFASSPPRYKDKLEVDGCPVNTNLEQLVARF